jgi:hypothetical protein
LNVNTLENNNLHRDKQLFAKIAAGDAEAYSTVFIEYYGTGTGIGTVVFKKDSEY